MKRKKSSQSAGIGGRKSIDPDDRTFGLDAQVREQLQFFETALVESKVIEWAGVTQAEDALGQRRIGFYLVERSKPDDGQDDDDTVGAAFDELTLALRPYAIAELFYVYGDHENNDDWRDTALRSSRQQYGDAEFIREIPLSTGADRLAATG